MKFNFFSCLVLAVWLFGCFPMYGLANTGVVRLRVEGDDSSTSTSTMVKLGWAFTKGCPKDFMGFNLKRQDSTNEGEWVQLNDSLLEVRTDGMIDWSDRGVTNDQLAKILLLFNGDSYQNHYKKYNQKEFIDELQSSIPNNFTVTEQFMSMDFYNYFLSGCGYIDYPPEGSHDYLYGLFSVTEADGESHTPDSTALYSDNPLKSLEIIDNVITEITPQRVKNDTNIMRLKCSFDMQAVELLQISHIYLYKKDESNNEVKCSTVVFRPERAEFNGSRIFTDYQNYGSSVTNYKFYMKTWLGTRMPLCEYTLDYQKHKKKLTERKKEKEDKIAKYKAKRSSEGQSLKLSQIVNKPHDTVVSWDVEDGLKSQVDHFVIVGRKLPYELGQDYSTPFKTLQGSIPAAERSFAFREYIEPGTWEYQVKGMNKDGDEILASNIQSFKANDYSQFAPLPTGLEVVDTYVKENKLHVKVRWDEKDPDDKKTDGYWVFADYKKGRKHPLKISKDGVIKGNEYTYVIPLQFEEERDITIYLSALSSDKSGATNKDFASVTFRAKPVYIPHLDEFVGYQINKMNRTITFTWEYEDIGNLKGFRLYERFRPESPTEPMEEKMIADFKDIPKKSRSYTMPIPSNIGGEGRYEYYIVPVSIYNSEPVIPMFKGAHFSCAQLRFELQ